MVILGQKIERTQRYQGIFTADGTQMKFCTDMEISLDDSAVDRDRIDDGTPAFTRVGDILGTFRFRVKNTVDLYDTVDATATTFEITYWQRKIADLDFASLTFIETFKSPTSTGLKFARSTFIGRITKVGVIRRDNVAVEDVEVSGEITTWTSSIRQAS